MHQNERKRAKAKIDETKRQETTRNETKRNETKRNQTSSTFLETKPTCFGPHRRALVRKLSCCPLSGRSAPTEFPRWPRPLPACQSNANYNESPAGRGEGGWHEETTIVHEKERAYNTTMFENIRTFWVKYSWYSLHKRTLFFQIRWHDMRCCSHILTWHALLFTHIDMTCVVVGYTYWHDMRRCSHVDIDMSCVVVGYTYWHDMRRCSHVDIDMACVVVVHTCWHDMRCCSHMSSSPKSNRRSQDKLH